MTENEQEDFNTRQLALSFAIDNTRNYKVEAKTVVQEAEIFYQFLKDEKDNGF